MAYVVVDTHIFNRSLVAAAEYREVMDTIVNVCDSVVVNRQIVREYIGQAHRAGISAELVQRVIQGHELLAVGKIRRTANRSGGRPLEAIPQQDQPFVEAAIAANAEYLISNDPNFQSQRNSLSHHRINVVYPHEYVSSSTRL